MKKLFLFTLVCLMVHNADAQNGKRRKRKYDASQNNNLAPDGFNVAGFSTDVDGRKIKESTKKPVEIVNTDEVDGKHKKIKHSRHKNDAVRNKNGSLRNRDIETLMNDMDLAKIQRPVFRGIMTESLRDITSVMNNGTLSEADKNIELKQIYMLQGKRVKETLNDDQWHKWLRIKDDDEYFEIKKPEDY